MDSAEQCRGRADLWKHMGFCRAHGRKFGTLSALLGDRLTDGKAPSRLFGEQMCVNMFPFCFCWHLHRRCHFWGQMCGSVVQVCIVEGLYLCSKHFSQTSEECVKWSKNPPEAPKKSFFLCWCTKHQPFTIQSCPGVCMCVVVIPLQAKSTQLSLQAIGVCFFCYFNFSPK